MTTKRNNTNIELRNEEVQELMGKIPPAILRFGIFIIFFFFITIILVSSFINYPDIEKVPINVKNVTKIIGIKTNCSGQILKINLKRHHVYKGDTLVWLLTSKEDELDTVCIVSPTTGITYPCNSFSKGNYIEKNTILFVLADSIQQVIISNAFVSNNLRKKIKIGMPIEADIDGICFYGKVNNIAKYANPINRTYAIALKFDTPKEFNDIILWKIPSVAKIRISNQSIFDKFFRSKIMHDM
jgi:hypothetical protein